ncbi:MAG: hypothetical protein RR012_00010, partial [Oscillospiraceae bacterium]
EASDDNEEISNKSDDVDLDNKDLLNNEECTDEKDNLTENGLDFEQESLTTKEKSNNNETLIKNLEETEFFEGDIIQKKITENIEQEISKEIIKEEAKQKANQKSEEQVFDFEFAGYDPVPLPEISEDEVNDSESKDSADELLDESVEVEKEPFESTNIEQTDDVNDFNGANEESTKTVSDGNFADEYENPYLEVAEELKQPGLDAFYAAAASGYDDRRLEVDDTELEDVSNMYDSDEVNATSDVDVENMIDALNDQEYNPNEKIELSENDEIYELYELLKATRDFSPKPTILLDKNNSNAEKGNSEKGKKGKKDKEKK